MSAAPALSAMLTEGLLHQKRRLLRSPRWAALTLKLSLCWEQEGLTCPAQHTITGAQAISIKVPLNASAPRSPALSMMLTESLPKLSEGLCYMVSIGVLCHQDQFSWLGHEDMKI